MKNFTYCRNQDQVIRYDADHADLNSSQWFAETVTNYTGDVSALPEFDEPGMPWHGLYNPFKEGAN